jgi:hypothetical protein
MCLRNKIAAGALCLAIAAVAVSATTANATESNSSGATVQTENQINTTQTGTQTNTLSLDYLQSIINQLKAQIQALILQIQTRNQGIYTDTLTSTCVAAGTNFTDNTKRCCAGLNMSFVGSKRVPEGCGSSLDGGNGVACTSITTTYTCLKPISGNYVGFAGTDNETISGNNDTGCEIKGSVFSDSSESCCAGLVRAKIFKYLPEGCGNESGQTPCTSTVDRYTCKTPTTYNISTALPCATIGVTFTGSGTKQCCNGSTLTVVNNACAGGETAGCGAQSTYKCVGGTTTTACEPENASFTDNTKQCCSGLNKTYVSSIRVPAGCNSEIAGGTPCTSVTATYTCKKPATEVTGTTTSTCAAAGTIFKPGTRTCCTGLTLVTATDGCAGVTATTESARYACFQNTTYTCKATTTGSLNLNDLSASLAQIIQKLSEILEK